MTIVLSTHTSYNMWYTFDQYFATEKKSGDKIICFHSIALRLYGGEPGNEATSISSEGGRLPRSLMSSLARLRGNGVRWYSPFLCTCAKLK